MITSDESRRAYQRKKAVVFRKRHGQNWKDYHLDNTRRIRAGARAAKGKRPTPTDLALPAIPVKCPSL
jgi:hypothetical protein